MRAARSPSLAGLVTGFNSPDIVPVLYARAAGNDALRKALVRTCLRVSPEPASPSAQRQIQFPVTEYSIPFNEWDLSVVETACLSMLDYELSKCKESGARIGIPGSESIFSDFFSIAMSHFAAPYLANVLAEAISAIFNHAHARVSKVLSDCATLVLDSLLSNEDAVPAWMLRVFARVHASCGSDRAVAGLLFHHLLFQAMTHLDQHPALLLRIKDSASADSPLQRTRCVHVAVLVRRVGLGQSSGLGTIGFTQDVKAMMASYSAKVTDFVNNLIERGNKLLSGGSFEDVLSPQSMLSQLLSHDEYVQDVQLITHSVLKMLSPFSTSTLHRSLMTHAQRLHSFVRSSSPRDLCLSWQSASLLMHHATSRWFDLCRSHYSMALQPHASAGSRKSYLSVLESMGTVVVPISYLEALKLACPMTARDSSTEQLAKDFERDVYLVDGQEVSNLDDLCRMLGVPDSSEEHCALLAPFGRTMLGGDSYDALLGLTGIAPLMWAPVGGPAEPVCLFRSPAESQDSEGRKSQNVGAVLRMTYRATRLAEMLSMTSYGNTSDLDNISPPVTGHARSASTMTDLDTSDYEDNGDSDNSDTGSVVDMSKSSAAANSEERYLPWAEATVTVIRHAMLEESVAILQLRKPDAPPEETNLLDAIVDGVCEHLVSSRM